MSITFGVVTKPYVLKDTLVIPTGELGEGTSEANEVITSEAGETNGAN